MKENFYTYIKDLQNKITVALEEIDQLKKFKEDIWERKEGGGGKSRVLENGKIFEKAGVNISAVNGKLPESMKAYLKVNETNFFACGLSLVIHPLNPMIPTTHANWRYFELYNNKSEIIDQWFGGGQDLTPYYLFEEDAIHFHKICKYSCDKFGKNLYSNYKKNCDNYFWNSHRNEARGIGGIFFDYLRKDNNHTIEDWYNFTTEVGNNFIKSYTPIVEKRKNTPYNKEQKKWQEIRRGRYVEFNLIHDKGTLFGLKTNGRIESILMSLPPKVQWLYDCNIKAESEEERLINVLKKPRKWIN